MNLALNLVAVAATVLGSWMAFPQARLIARTRRIEGVSAVWIGVSLALNAWWLAYGAAVGVWALVPVSTVAIFLYGIMAYFFVASSRRPGLAGMTLGFLGLGMIPLPFLVMGGWKSAGVAVGLSYAAQLLPAVVASLRTSQLDGVAPATWIIALVESGLWLVYGIGVADIALVLAGIAGTTLASVILARLAITGHRPFVVLDPRRRTELATSA